MVEIIDSLVQYTVYHFKYEENLFNKYDHEFNDEHINEHNKLIEEIEKMDLRAVD